MKKIGEILVEKGFVLQNDIDEALELQSKGNQNRLGAILIEKKLLNENELLEVLSIQTGFSLFEKSDIEKHDPAVSNDFPIMLARKFNAKIIPVFIQTKDYEKYTITFYKPIICPKTKNSEEDIKVCTQAQADITEKVIRQKPDEWFWFHKRWKNMYEEIYK